MNQIHSERLDYKIFQFRRKLINRQLSTPRRMNPMLFSKQLKPCSCSLFLYDLAVVDLNPVVEALSSCQSELAIE